MILDKLTFISKISQIIITIFFETKVSLCSPGYLGIHYVDQAGLDLIVILLSRPLEYLY